MIVNNCRGDARRAIEAGDEALTTSTTASVGQVCRTVGDGRSIAQLSASTSGVQVKSSHASSASRSVRLGAVGDDCASQSDGVQSEALLTRRAGSVVDVTETGKIASGQLTGGVVYGQESTIVARSACRNSSVNVASFDPARLRHWNAHVVGKVVVPDAAQASQAGAVDPAEGSDLGVALAISA